jgi:hypothetical protein
MRFDPPRPHPLLLLALSLALAGCDRIGEPPPPSLAEAPQAGIGRADAGSFQTSIDQARPAAAAPPARRRSPRPRRCQRPKRRRFGSAMSR